MAMGHENLDEMSKDDLILESNRPSTIKVDSELSILNALLSLQGMAMNILRWVFDKFGSNQFCQGP